jgi:hypothetical protein
MKYGLWAGAVLMSYVREGHYLKVNPPCIVQHITHTNAEGSTSCTNDMNLLSMFHIPTMKKQKESQQQ